MRQTLDNSAEVVGVAKYDPWGTPQVALGTPFGFTGELQQQNNVYLRARWYEAARGSFGVRDPFIGWPEKPYSSHQYQYGYADPMGNLDPSGYFACINAFKNNVADPLLAYSRFCAKSYRVANKWVDSGGRNGLGILISLFSANDFPGGDSPRARANRISTLTPAAERLEFILDLMTDKQGTPFQKPLWDADFNSDFQDPWIGESDRQGNHFLTAVGLAYAPEAYVRTTLFWTMFSGLEPNPDRLSDEEVALRLIVGHEKSPDVPQSDSFRLDRLIYNVRAQYQSATSEDVTFFLLAVRADAYEDLGARDCLLRAIIPGLPDDRAGLLALQAGGVDRTGNSLQDLRLSVRGWRFGKMIRNGEISTLDQAWRWLDGNLR